jgi:hypothetical protein
VSEKPNRGCGFRRFKMLSCCLSARFSTRRSRRERADRTSKKNRSLSVRGICPS